MARGYMYEISCEEIDNLFGLNTTDWDAHNGIDWDFTENIPKNHASKLVSDMLDMMEKYGAKIGKEDGIRYFLANTDMKKRYFSERLAQLKKIVADITEEEFADKYNSPDYKIISLVDDPYSDCVSYNGCFYTFDDFIRNMKPEKKYYVGNEVLFLH